jgi:glycosyltransferase involved in cell wall biosynthesis
LIWHETQTNKFYTAEGIENFLGNLMAAHDAPPAPGSRRAKLLADYYPHHIERHEHERIAGASSDADIVRLSHRYFHVLARQVPGHGVRVPDTIAAVLNKPVFDLGNGRHVDALMDYACAHAEFPFSARPDPAGGEGGEAAIATIAGRYAGQVAPKGGIPLSLIPTWIVEWLDRVPERTGPAAMNVTNMMLGAQQNHELLRHKYDPLATRDSLLVFLDLLGLVLLRATQFRPQFARMLPEPGSHAHTWLMRMLTALVGACATDMMAAIAGETIAERSMPATAADTAQHVLLVGFASRGTGLGRNFDMLKEALRGNEAGNIVTEIHDIDAKGFDITARLREWRQGAGARPIVVYAVNAEDVPWAMIKDVRGALAGAYAVGFFLWEASRTPEVQRLGIDLVDEVWAPSQYVADIYAPLVRTHLVGKGLYEGAGDAPPQPPLRPFRFLTVFDFDSSIERKNPLAAALAFKKAFVPGEDVELVLKGTGVKPDHWSNRLGQWERLTQAIAGDRRIKLITERIPDADMIALQKSAACVLSLHRSEGFGYVTADAMAMGTPVIATAYSGNADYCTAETSFPVDYTLIPIDPKVMVWAMPGAEWADADIDSAARQMRAVFTNYKRAREVAAKGRALVLSKYAKETFRHAIVARINAIRSR